MTCSSGLFFRTRRDLIIRTAARSRYEAFAIRANRPLQGMLLWLVALWAITAIDPLNRRDWFLENLLVLIYGFLLVVSYRRFAFSNLSYALFTVFLSLHLVGAHYSAYSETPFGYGSRTCSPWNAITTTASCTFPSAC